MNPYVEAWRKWASEGTKPERRRIVIQMINMWHLGYKWESFERSVENMRFMAVLPQNAGEIIKKVALNAQEFGWEPNRIRYGR